MMDGGPQFAAQSGENLIRDRHVRVFISSTFRDMQRERDHLIKFTFPELRRLCESRGVIWTEVDLRWGVTSEEAAEGKVLPICLEEIRRCRPYFIGMLGERYGPPPEAFSPEMIERDQWLKDHVSGGKSLTELEILHGVLNDPKMEHHAFFYFRDPAYTQGIGMEQRADFVCENPAVAQKLIELKERIRSSGFPVRENFADAQALGDLVLKDFTAVINSLYPEGSQPDPLDREEMDHACYAANRAKVYVGRQAYFDRLDSYAAGNEERPLVILGESGSGKSALLANWGLRYQREHPSDVVIQHFIGASPYSADWIAMLRRIMGELARKLEINRPIPDQPQELRAALGTWMALAGAKGRVLLVLDALNQLQDNDQALDLPWLPELTPANTRVVVSTLPGKALEEVQRRCWPVLTVEPLNAAERETLISKYLAQYAKALGPARRSQIAGAPQSANPLYLRVLLDELRLFGRHEALDAQIDYYLKADCPYTLYGRVIKRWENDYEGDSDLVGDSLSLLWAARRGLSEAELLEALGTQGNPLPRARWSPLYLAMSGGLVSRGGLLTFAHDFLRSAARDAYVPMESHQRDAHLCLADYFEQQTPGPRRLDELAWQLCEGKAWKRLATFFNDRKSFISLWERNQFEVKTYWAAIEASSSLRLIDMYRETIESPSTEHDKLFLRLLYFLLSHMGHPNESLRLRSHEVDHFRKTGNLEGLQQSLGNQALILQDRGDSNGAMTSLKRQESICYLLGNTDSLQTCLFNQANILQQSGDLDSAMMLYGELETACRRSQNVDDLQYCLGSQASILLSRGDLDEAMTLCKVQERICQQLGNIYSLSICLNNQAGVFKARDQFREAIALLKEQGRICQQLGDAEGLAYSLANQAAVLGDMGRPQDGLPLMVEAHRLATFRGYAPLARRMESNLNRLRRDVQDADVNRGRSEDSNDT